MRHPVGEGLVAGKIRGVVLGEISNLGTVGPLHLAGIWLISASQALQECGFTNPVRANNSHAFSRLNLQIQVFEQGGAFIEALGQTFQSHGLTMQLLALLEADKGTHAA